MTWPEDELTQDEIAAVHEAAHAVFAVFGDWTKLAGPVALKDPGHGDVVLSTDGAAIGRSLRIDRRFDRDLPRLQLVCSLLAGPAAERLLIERGRARLSEADLSAASEGDYANVAVQLGKLDPPRPDLLDRLERHVRERLEQPRVWSAVERFASILLVRRRLDAEEATAILREMRPLEPFPAFRERRRRPGLAALVAGLFLRRRRG